MRTVRTLSVMGLLGVGYSCVFLLFSPWPFQFLPAVAVAHMILLAVVFVLAGLTEIVLPDAFRTPVRVSFAVLVGLHLFFWLLTRSNLRVVKALEGLINFNLSNPQRPLFVLTSLIVTLAVIVLGVILFRWINGESRYHRYVSLILLGLLVCVKVYFAGVAPTRRLILATGDENSPNPPVANDGPPLLSRIYPFSVGVLDGVRRYSWMFSLEPKGDWIVFLLLDGFRNDYFGKTMNGQSVTPNLDELAREGTYFPQYRVQSSWTKPSTASLFTGRYLRDHGVFYGGGDQSLFLGHVLPDRYRTLAERLSDRGYDNYGTVMSSHVSANYNFDQGFDVWLSPGRGFGGDFSSLDRTVFWLLREKPEKAFVYLHLKGPHQPFRLAYRNRSFWETTQYFRNGKIHPEGRFSFTTTRPVDPIKDGEIELKPEEKTFLRHLYGAQLNVVDRLLVRPFLEGLDRLGVKEDSLIAVTGDHGEELGDHGSYAHGQTLYEETIHTPLIVKPPGDWKTGSPPRNYLVETVDLTATLTHYGGAARTQQQGKSFLPGLKSGDWPAGDDFSTSFAEEPEKESIRAAAVVRYPWKLIHRYTTDTDKLYNLREDPGETDPVTGMRGKKNRLLRRIYSRLGSDSSADAKSVSLKEATEAEKRNLEGLGYL